MPAGLRRPVERTSSTVKGCFGLDESQARLCTAVARHVVLVMAALAICAVTATHLRSRTGTVGATALTAPASRRPRPRDDRAEGPGAVPGLPPACSAGPLAEPAVRASRMQRALHGFSLGASGFCVILQDRSSEDETNKWLLWCDCVSSRGH